jgi:hypothetical protein
MFWMFHLWVALLILHRNFALIGSVAIAVVERAMTWWGCSCIAVSEVPIVSVVQRELEMMSAEDMLAPRTYTLVRLHIAVGAVDDISVGMGDGNVVVVVVAAAVAAVGVVGDYMRPKFEAVVFEEACDNKAPQSYVTPSLGKMHKIVGSFAAAKEKFVDIVMGIPSVDTAIGVDTFVVPVSE